MNELDFKKFSLFAQQLDATGNHLNFLVDMLSHQDLTSKESGGLTDAGFATISLRFSSIENYRQSIKNRQDGALPSVRSSLTSSGKARKPSRMKKKPS